MKLIHAMCIWVNMFFLRLGFLLAAICIVSACGGSSSGSKTNDADTSITIVTPENLLVAAASLTGTEASDGAIQTFLDSATAFDENGVVIETIANDAPNVFPMGESRVTFTASLPSGNSRSASAVVTVADLRAPVITLVGSESLSIFLGETYVEPGFSAVDDLDGTLTDSVSVTNLIDNSREGDYTVTYQVMDNSGNMSSIKTRSVTVVNPEAPILVVPEGIVVAAVDGSGVSISHEEIQSFVNSVSAEDVKDGVIENIQNDLPDQLGLGLTVVTFSVLDSDGYETRGSATITVRDLTAPVISLLGDATLSLRIGAPFNDPGVSAIDNVDGDLSSRVTVTGNVDASIEGVYQLTYNVEDNSGNQAVSEVRTIYVESDGGPVDLGISVYYKKPANWASAGIHYWGPSPSNALPVSMWPGFEMQDLGNDWYAYHFAFVEEINLLFNSGDLKTEDLYRNASGCYADGEWQTLDLCTLPAERPVTLALSLRSQDFYEDYLTVQVAAFEAPDSAEIFYSVDGSDPSTSALSVLNGGVIRIGEQAAFDEEIVLQLAYGDARYSATYTKRDASEGLTIQALVPADWESANIHYFDAQPSGVLPNTTWPGESMTHISGNHYSITLRGATSASLIFSDNGQGQTANLVRTGNGCYLVEQEMWMPTCDLALEVTADPGSRNIYDDMGLAVTLNIIGESAVVGRYSLDGKDPRESGMDFIDGDVIQIGAGLALDDVVTLRLFAETADESSEASYTYSRTAPPAADAFSWDNATVYFVLTDRFLDADPLNNNSYGRERAPDGTIYEGYKSRLGTFHGGDLKGLTQKINEGYFADLGVNAIWLSSPLEQIHGFVGGENFKHYAYHGYYHLDYTEIDANMGTREDFAEFVDTAHANGIRVVMDIIMNHAGYETIGDMDEFNFGSLNDGWESFYHTADDSTIHYDTYGSYINTSASTETQWSQWWGGDWVRKSNGSGGYPGYTQCGGDDKTICLAGLPDFRTESTVEVSVPLLLQNKWGTTKTSVEQNELNNFFQGTGLEPTVRNHLIKWITDWVREYGVDGFRVDTAKHVNLADWAELKVQASAAYEEWKANNPRKLPDDQDLPFWMTGEVWGHDVSRTSYFDYGFDSVVNFSFQSRAGDMNNLPALFSEYASKINSDPSFNVLSYISSHDTSLQNRSNLMNTGTALLLSPGAVQIFYGDETARPAGEIDIWDEATRSDMNWASINQDVLTHWQKLGQFRARHRAVGAGSHRELNSAPYTFVREVDQDQVVVVFAPLTTATIDVSDVWADGVELVDAYSNQAYTVASGSVSLVSQNAQPVFLLERVQ